MERKKHNIKIPKEIILDPTITGFDLAIYIQLDICSIKIFNESICLGTGTIAEKLYGTPSSHVSKIKISFKKLSTIFPDYIKKTNLDSYYNVNINNISTKSYAIISLEEYDTIMNNADRSRYNLLKHFLVIIASVRGFIKLHDKSFIATNYGIGWYMGVENTTAKTISMYTSALEKMELIYVVRDPKCEKTNVIGRKCDAKYIFGWALQNGYKGTTRNYSDNKRSLMQKYNYLCKMLATNTPCSYTPEEIQEIHDYINEYNRKCYAKAEIDGEMLNKIKDTSVFDTYHN